MSAEQKTLDFYTLIRLEPLSSLSPDQIQEVVDKITIKDLEPGTRLFQEGDTDATALYLISGEIELNSAGAQGATRLVAPPPGEPRRPVAEEKPRRATAIAVKPVRIACIDEELLDTLLTWSQVSSSEEVVMSDEDIINIDKGSLKDKIQRSPNFRKLPAANIEQLLERMEPMRVHAGDVIIRQGEEGDYFYVINQGSALVSRERNDEDGDNSIELAELNEGDSFGEAALISDNPRNATVSMTSDGVLLRLFKEDFLRLLKEPTLHWVSLAEGLAQGEQGACWIDVRLGSEYAHLRLPGAIHVPLNDMHSKARELDHNKPYVLYCQTGRRSSAAAFILSQYGIAVSVLKGGLQNLADQELKSLVKGDEASETHAP